MDEWGSHKEIWDGKGWFSVPYAEADKKGRIKAPFISIFCTASNMTVNEHGSSFELTIDEYT